MSSKLTTLILAFLLVFACIRIGAAEEVDLELVLAMDGSGSISEAEYILQLEGTAQAFEDLAIQQAMLSGPTGRVAVAMMIWSDAAFPKFKSKWFLLDSVAKAQKFANFIRVFHKHTGRKFGIGGGGTGIGDGIRVSLEMLAGNSYQGLRRVIDVSGDGVETDPWFEKATTLPVARQLARTQDVQVNGLPIISQDFPWLDSYYRDQVITGAGSFIVVAQGFEDFGRAIREKLKRELSPPVAQLHGPVRVARQ